MQVTYLHLVFLGIGIALTWIIRKLIVDKDLVPVKNLNEVMDQLQSIKTEKAIADNNWSRASEEVKKLFEQIQVKDSVLERLQADFTKADTERDVLILDVNDKNVEINCLKETIASKQAELDSKNKSIARMESELTYSREKLEEQAKAIDDIGKKYEGSFSNLAQKILDEKALTFNVQQENNLKQLLEPFKADITNFKREFTEKHSLEAAERNTLKGVIQEMVHNNKTLSEQANNLTKALTFQAKQQGSWGEEILESILEHCGLQNEIHYKKQFSSKNEDGTRIQPDFIVNCPDNRCIIIDSKVSLTHFTSYCSTTVSEEQQAFAKGLLLSIKAHIDGLSAKNYTDISNTLDAVIMFVPVESAYILAMQIDCDLWRYAYNKGVVLISPSNLITTIKLISNLWQRDAINKNAKLIAEKAGRLYDKMVGFLDNMNKVEDCLKKANENFSHAYGQLYKGHGNMIRQAEAIKALGAKTGTKKFPDALINEALANDTLALDATPGE